MKRQLAIIALSGTWAVVAAQGTTRVYVEERVKATTGVNVHCDNVGNCYGHSTTTARNVSLEVTRDLSRDCGAVTVTDNREAADYVLRIAPGASTLFEKNGDVAYNSPARFKVSNLAKDVCDYVQRHPTGSGPGPQHDLSAPPPPGAVARCGNGTFALVDLGDATCSRAGGVVERFKPLPKPNSALGSNSSNP